MSKMAALNGEPIEDSWSEWEYPTLLVIARWEQNNPMKGFLALNEVAERVGCDPKTAWKVGRAIDRLDEAGLISVNRSMDGTPWPGFVNGLTTAGLRMVGAWPTAAALQADLVEHLLQAANRIELDQPAKAGRLREAADALGGVASDVFAKVIAELLAKAAGAR